MYSFFQFQKPKSSPLAQRFLFQSLHPLRFYSSENPFKSLKISNHTLNAIEKSFKFTQMTDVQSQVLSLLPINTDLLCRGNLKFIYSSIGIYTKY
jgi:ribosomal protein L28